MSTPHPAFDPRPLLEPVDPRAIDDYAAQLKASGHTGGSGQAARVIVVVLAIAIGGSVALSMFIGVIFSMVGSGLGRGGGLLGAFGLIPLVVIIGVGALIAVFAVRGNRAKRERWYRLSRFAAANGMLYLPRLEKPSLPGMIFGAGHSQFATDLLRGQQPRFVEFANYQYTTGSGKNQSTHRWGYVAVHLDVPLPHIVLDALSNNGLFGSNLPSIYDKDQRLSLEGDFDRYFSLYCPVGYEQDALYLFTPDIMARFIDNVAAMDVEIVDDWMFLYAKRDLSTLDPATWAWLFSVLSALLDKLAQWARWRDERLLQERTDAAAYAFAVHQAPAAALPGGATAVPEGVVPGTVPGTPAALLRPPPGVARPGQRLSKRFPWAAAIIAGVFVLIWVVGQMLPAIIGLFSVR